MHQVSRTIGCTLDGDGHDAQLAVTQHAFHEAATWIARVGRDAGITHQTSVDRRVSGQTRRAFGLGAQ
jgi:hypothetical protein